jgi:hypothetical protein
MEEENGLPGGTLPEWGLEAEVIIAGLLPFMAVQPFRIPAAAKVRTVVGVVGSSLKLDSERWLRLGRGGEGEGGVWEWGFE